jgi:Lon protease-like protein
MDRTELTASLRKLRCFPLPGAVLMPGAAMPLHVFEPRYRALVADTLAGDGLIAVPQIAEGQEALHLASPKLLPYVAVGRVVMHHALPDGRYNILVEPVGRVRLGGELDRSTPYRQFEAELLTDVEAAEDARTRVGKRVAALLGPTLAAARADTQRIERTLRQLAPGDLPAALAPMVLQAASERQAYIAEDDVLERARMVEMAMLTVIAEHRSTVAEA